MKSYLDQFEEDKLYYKAWSEITSVNIGEKTKQAIHIKQNLAGKLNTARYEKLKLSRRRASIQKLEIVKQVERSPVVMDKSTMEKIKNLPDLEEIDKQIQELDFYIKYLEEMMKVFMYIAQDIKNIIDCLKIDLDN